MTIKRRNHKTSVIELIGNIEISFPIFNQIFHNVCPSIKTSGSKGCGVTFGFDFSQSSCFLSNMTYFSMIPGNKSEK
jgi:hypothetical protein